MLRTGAPQSSTSPRGCRGSLEHQVSSHTSRSHPHGHPPFLPVTTQNARIFVLSQSRHLTHKLNQRNGLAVKTRPPLTGFARQAPGVLTGFAQNGAALFLIRVTRRRNSGKLRQDQAVCVGQVVLSVRPKGVPGPFSCHLHLGVKYKYFQM